MRMKNMRKPAALLMMVILTLSMLAGCMSPLGRALEREKHLAQADELDLDEILSDSEGYHFPGLTWNMTIKEIREATGAPLNAVQGYSEAGEVIYTGDGMLKRLLDCKNDETCVTVDQDGVGFMVSLVYMNSADKPVTRPMTLEELFNQYKEKLKEKFSDIQSSSEITVESANQIKEIIHQQSAAFDQIVATVRQISSGIENFSNSTGTVNNTAHKLQEAANLLENLHTQIISSEI